MLSFGYDHSEDELGLYLDDLSICLEKDRSLDLAEFTLWVLKLSETIEQENQQIVLEDEQAFEDSIPKQATFANIVKREELTMMRANRQKLEGIIDEITMENDAKLHAVVDFDKKGYVSFGDIERLSLELGESWSFKDLDGMMEAVTTQGAQRKINLQMMRSVLQTPLAWNEPDMLPVQAELLANQEALRQLELQRAGGAQDEGEKYGKEKRRARPGTAKPPPQSGGCGVM